MILKMRTQGDNAGIAWRLIDNICRIEYKLNIDETKEMKGYKEMGITYITTFPNIPERKLTEIYVLYKDGCVETMYTDDVVYVLNDEGKTCDKINFVQ